MGLPRYWLVVLAICWVSKAKPITYRMNEEQPPNTLVGRLAEDHGYPNTKHFYKLEVGAPFLRVDGTTGEIYTTELPIDRESLPDCQKMPQGDPCFLEFEVSMTDPAKIPRLLEGRIEIIDINDNTPNFPSPVITLHIPENTPVGNLFPIRPAIDHDIGANGVARYELLTGPEYQSLFSLQVADEPEEKQPQLIVLGNLDREMKDNYDLTIRVHDGGIPPRSSSAILRITISDTNDNAPKFEKSAYEAELPENSPVGHSVLQVKANDSDQGVNAEIEYLFHQPPDAVKRLFHLDRNTGLISVQGSVDREEIGHFRFTVIAKDKGNNPKSAKTQVVINVKDVNDNAPTIEIRGIGLVTHHGGTANITEDVPVETAVALVQVSDRDEGENAAVICVVAGDVPFQLKPASESNKKYFLQTTSPLDYETSKEYTIMVVAVDSGNPPLSSTNSLKVQVVDVNDNAPIFAQSVLEVQFPENNEPGDILLDVDATDADSGSNAQLVYSIVLDPSTENDFEIDPNSGTIKVKTILDREQRERYEFQVLAADKGLPSLKGTATVIVRVLDKNDNDPKFMLSGYNFSVMENMPPLSPVGMVTVIDDDAGENAHVRLFVEPDNGDFVIQNGSGTILSSISFDREQQSTYTFRLKAVDGGVPPRSAYVGVTINVLDVNDNAPYVTQPSNSSYRHISTQNKIGTPVERVKAEDIDSGLNSELTYSITGGNPYELFHISSSSGDITLEKEILRKHLGLHRLVVRVNDKGKPSRHATALVHVFVNETLANISVVEALVGHSLDTPLDRDIAGDPDYERSKQRSNILFGVIAGIIVVILVIVIVVLVMRYCKQKDAKSGYQAGKKETKDLYAPKQNNKIHKNRNKKNKSPKPPKPADEDEEAGLQKALKFNLMNDSVGDSPRIHLPLNYPPGSPDLGRHYRSNSPLPSIQLQPQSPTASKKHQVVQDLPAANTFVGTGDNNSTGSDQYSDYSYKTNPQKYCNKQVGDLFLNTTGADRNILWTNVW